MIMENDRIDAGKYIKVLYGYKNPIWHQCVGNVN